MINNYQRSKFSSARENRDEFFCLCLSRQLVRLQKHLEPVVSNDQLLETLQSLYDKHATNSQGSGTGTATLASKTARRLLVLLFVQSCQSRLEQIERLIQLIPLVFRSHDHQVNRFFFLSASVGKGFSRREASRQFTPDGTHPRESLTLSARLTSNLSSSSLALILWNGSVEPRQRRSVSPDRSTHSQGLSFESF